MKFDKPDWHTWEHLVDENERLTQELALSQGREQQYIKKLDALRLKYTKVPGYRMRSTT